jgi:hydroxyacylglutathione hydrolase
VSVLKIARETVGEFQENCYLVMDDTSGHAALVDPGAEPARLLRMVSDAGAKLKAIWLTHAHLDHVGAIEGIRRAHTVPVYLHPLDRPLYDRAAEVASMYGIPFEQPGSPDRELAEGDVLTLDRLRFHVLHVPGHAPGHVMFVGEGGVFGGDLLFRGSIGRTDLPFANAHDMTASLIRIGALPAETFVYPGHGERTTVGEEVATNPFLNGAAFPVRG